MAYHMTQHEGAHFQMCKLLVQSLVDSDGWGLWCHGDKFCFSHYTEEESLFYVAIGQLGDKDQAHLPEVQYVAFPYLAWE